MNLSAISKYVDSQEKKTIPVQLNDEISFNVATYLPIEDKYQLVLLAANDAYEEGIYNPIKEDISFYCYLVVYYTDLDILGDEIINEQSSGFIYDILYRSGVLDAVVKAIPKEEYDVVYTYFQDYIKNKTVHNYTVASSIRDIFNNLPEQAEQFSEIMKNFDADKFTEIQEFVKAANAGRDIKTNK